MSENNTIGKVNSKIKNIINSSRMQNTFTASNLLGIFCNIFLFIVVQTLFFYTVASKQFNMVLEEKVDILNTYFKYDKESAENMEEYLKSERVRQIKEDAKVQEKNRNEANIQLIKDEIGPLLLITTGFILLVIFAMRMNKENKWSSFEKTDKVLLGSVLLAYSTELLFFFGIVRQFEFVGDHEILFKFFQNIRTKLRSSGEQATVGNIRSILNRTGLSGQSNTYKSSNNDNNKDNDSEVTGYTDDSYYSKV